MITNPTNCIASPKHFSINSPIIKKQFLLSPSTTHISVIPIKNKKQSTIKKGRDKKIEKTIPLLFHCTNLHLVKENLNHIFANQKTIDNIINDQDSPLKAHNELISKSSSHSNSQSSCEEMTLIENLTQKEYTCSYSKKSKTQNSKQLSYEGTIELANEHTGVNDLFKTYKDKEIWATPITDNVLLHDEDNQDNESDEEILTQSTQCVIRELCDGIDMLNKEKKTLEDKTSLLSRNMHK